MRITVACGATTVVFLGCWWLFALVPGLDGELELAAFVASLVLFVVGYWVLDDSRRQRGFDLNKAADDLAAAVQQQWQAEEEQRRIHDPVALPVRWRRARADLADHLANITLTQVGASVGAMLLDGRIEQVAEVYRRVPSGRMVVLGRAGSGKTVLASRLTLDLLAAREPGGMVPVVVSIGSWNPDTPLREWLAERLARDYPGLEQKPRRGKPSLATSLVQAGRILPILDGFDEIADGWRSAALRALNEVARMPLVMTSRVEEYAAAVTATDVLTSAAVVQLDELGTEDLVDYLPRTTRPSAGQHAGGWDEVVARLRARVDGANDQAAGVLGAALSTPLLVFLARTVYSDTPGNDPTDLLDTTRYPNASSVERHLLAAFLPTLYRQASRAPGRGWDGDRAQQWLVFLARHLNRLDTYDLAWWQLRRAGSRRARVRKDEPVPRRILLRTRGRVPGMLRALTAWLVIVLVYALAVGLSQGHMVGYVQWQVVAGAVGGVVGLATFFTAGLAAPADVTATIHIRDSVAADRISAVFLGLAFGFPMGMLNVIQAYMISGDLRGEGITSMLGVGLGAGLGWGLGFVFGGTAWGRWLIRVRLWLPLTGRLPWRVIGFLDDTHRRGVLRQAGAAYQFRHARLQDYLATSIPSK